MVSHARSQKRDLDPDWLTNATQFFRRGWHTSIALGDYIYIDGGEMYTNNTGNVLNVGVNSTYSLPISQDWTPQDVRLKRIDKGLFPAFNRENLWPSTDNKTIFAFNGDVSTAISLTASNQPDSPQLWTFTPDNDGGGVWNLTSVAGSLTQSSAAAGTIANGSAYLLGGLQDPRSSSSIFQGTLSADGLVSYNMATQTWENGTMSPFAPSGWSQEAQLHHLVGVGGNQFLLAMGGLTSEPLPQQTGRTAVPYDTVSIYNMQTKEWYNQSTTGYVPPGRGSACHLGIQGDNGTYEIFLHGGGIDGAPTNKQNIDLDRVYVLSIPSFTWHQESRTPTDARETHTCQVAGNRQMIVIGGIQPSIAMANFTADAWPQGLGIFDLSEMLWKDSYNASAAPYSTPGVIKYSIAVNGSYPSQWDSDVLKGLIVGQATNTSSTPPPSSPSPTDTKKKGSHAGAIAGGVVGGVIVLLLIIVGTWLFLRRRHKKSQPATNHVQEAETRQKSEMDSKQQPSEKPLEMAASSPKKPLEMNASPPKYELPTQEQKTATSELP